MCSPRCWAAVVTLLVRPGGLCAFSGVWHQRVALIPTTMHNIAHIDYSGTIGYIYPHIYIYIERERWVSNSNGMQLPINILTWTAIKLSAVDSWHGWVIASTKAHVIKYPYDDAKFRQLDVLNQQCTNECISAHTPTRHRITSWLYQQSFTMAWTLRWELECYPLCSHCP